jgi:hypothetical protein
MHEIEDEVRRARRKRILARGGAVDYDDPAIYAEVESTLRRALASLDHDALLVAESLSGEDIWAPPEPLTFSSHRPVVGPILVFIKRRLLLPTLRWLYEYTSENFRRQHQVNRVLLAYVEALAIENARLKRTLAEQRQEPGAR